MVGKYTSPTDLPKLQYFTNLDFAEIRDPISPKLSYMLGWKNSCEVAVIWPNGMGYLRIEQQIRAALWWSASVLFRLQPAGIFGGDATMFFHVKIAGLLKGISNQF